MSTEHYTPGRSEDVELTHVKGSDDWWALSGTGVDEWIAAPSESFVDAEQ